MVAVVGPRQSGKTTFLKHRLPPGGNYLLFDHPDLRSLFEDSFTDFELQHMKGRNLTVLDEVQQCKDAGPRLKYLVDSGYRLWTTSSSEVLLGQEVLSHLVGRTAILRLLPFNLREFLVAKGQRVLPERARHQAIWEHMAYGGYPEVVLTDNVEDKVRMLGELHLTMLLRDVVRTFSIGSMKDLELLTLYLAQSPGALLTHDAAASDLGMARATVKKYLEALQMSYLVHPVRPFFTNRRKELVKQQRYYFLDTGLRNAIARDFQNEPSGPLFENYVLTELVKMGFEPHYWRTKSKAEVDFIIRTDDGAIPVEVKLRPDPPKVETGLRAFIDQYAPERAFVVGLRGETASTEVSGCDVSFTHLPGLWESLTGKKVVG